MTVVLDEDLEVHPTQAGCPTFLTAIHRIQVNFPR